MNKDVPGIAKCMEFAVIPKVYVLMATSKPVEEILIDHKYIILNLSIPQD